MSNDELSQLKQNHYSTRQELHKREIEVSELSKGLEEANDKIRKLDEALQYVTPEAVERTKGLWRAEHLYAQLKIVNKELEKEQADLKKKLGEAMETMHSQALYIEALKKANERLLDPVTGADIVKISILKQENKELKSQLEAHPSREFFKARNEQLHKDIHDLVGRVREYKTIIAELEKKLNTNAPAEPCQNGYKTVQQRLHALEKHTGLI